MHSFGDTWKTNLFIPSKAMGRSMASILNRLIESLCQCWFPSRYRLKSFWGVSSKRCSVENSDPIGFSCGCPNSYQESGCANISSLFLIACKYDDFLCDRLISNRHRHLGKAGSRFSQFFPQFLRKTLWTLRGNLLAWSDESWRRTSSVLGSGVSKAKEKQNRFFRESRICLNWFTLL